MIKSFRKLNTDDALPSREWRPEGAPTTDEVLHVLLKAKGLSVVVFSVVLSPLQKKISE